MELITYFKSIMEQDPNPVVICDTQHRILYRNRAACRQYGGDAQVGESLVLCHPPRAMERINRVLAWFATDVAHNQVHTFYNPEQNKDVYMIALRDEAGALIGYYEKFISRNPDPTPLYQMN